AHTTTDATGAFTLSGIAAGDYEVVALVAGHPATSRRLRVAKDQRELTLPLVLAPSLDEQKAQEKAADAARSSTIANMPPAAMPPGPPPPPPAGVFRSTVQSGQAAGGGGGRGGGSGFASAAPAQVQGAGGYWPDTSWPPISGETYAPIEANGFQRTIARPL